MLEVFNGFRLRDLLDVAIVAFLLYRVFLVFRGTLAVQILVGLGLLIGVRFVAREADLVSIGFILDNFWTVWVLALIVILQPELRRALAETGRSRFLQRVFGDGSAARHHVVGEVVRAVESLAAKRIGGLIVLERITGLRNYAELGVPVDGAVSAELLGSLFVPTSPLHDGAVFIQEGRISVAGCFLPLSRNLQLARELGTRHRAALGLTEETDAVVVVVSEESGGISLAVGGRIEGRLDAAGLSRRLTELLAAPEVAAVRRGWLLGGVRRLTVRGKA